MVKQGSPAVSGAPFPRVPELIFVNWREVLYRSGLGAGMQTVYALAVSGYLDYCRHNGVSVTTDSARAFMEDVTRRGLARQPELWKQGLNWFFRAGRHHCATNRIEGLPTLGQADTGTTPWERRLIERLRLQHYSWRTEQTYREWCWRLAHFMQPRELETATDEDLKGFLSELAVKGKVAVATQKQALNALVFLFRQGLGREPGDLTGFQRSRRGPRVPTVLSRSECQRLFQALGGTMQLMAELMYGSGLRLMELLRLRVKDVDLDRQQLVVRGGKGDKDRVTMLPASLVERLRAHRDIRSVQDLLGHADVATTQLYTHVMNRPGLGLRSPLDGL